MDVQEAKLVRLHGTHAEFMSEGTRPKAEAI